MMINGGTLSEIYSADIIPTIKSLNSINTKDCRNRADPEVGSVAKGSGFGP